MRAEHSVNTFLALLTKFSLKHPNLKPLKLSHPDLCYICQVYAACLMVLRSKAYTLRPCSHVCG